MEISIKWNVCRVCLQEQTAKVSRCDPIAQLEQMRYIYSDEKLAKQIYECSGVMMKANDMLPDQICRNCLIVLKYAINFRTMCRNSDDYLQSVVQKTKSATSMQKLDKHRVETLELVSQSVSDITDNDTYIDIFDMESPRDGFMSDESCDMERQHDTSINLDHQVKRKRSQMNTKEDREDAGEIEMDQVTNENRKEEKPVKQTGCLSNKERKKSSSLKKEETDENLISLYVNQRCEPETETEEEHVHSGKHMWTISDSELSNDQEYIVGDADDTTDDTLENFDSQSAMRGSTTTYDVDEKHIAADDDGSQKGDSKTIHDILIDETISITTIATLGPEDKELVERAAASSADEAHENTKCHYLAIQQADIKRENDESMSSTSCHDDNVEHATEFISTIPEAMMENVEYLVEDSNDVAATMSADDGTNIANAKANLSKSPRQKTRGSKPSKLPVRKPKNQPSLNVLVCEICGNHFTNRNLMNFHMRIHRNEKKHECELCHKRFNTACNLTAHMRVHTGERPFQCQFCARRFTDRSTHIKHERVHTNEKPFVCSVCGNAFSLSTTLRAHEKVHSDERAHKCGPCGKSFKLPHQLKAHFNTHFHKMTMADNADLM